MSKKTKKSTDEPISSRAFKEGDLVGAKIKGYPLWPARIEKIEPIGSKKFKHTVRFFGTDETGSALIQLKHFSDFTDKDRSCNRKNFQEALKICQDEYDSLVGAEGIGNKKKIKSENSSEDSSSPEPLTISQPVPHQQKAKKASKRKLTETEEQVIVVPRKTIRRKEPKLEPSAPVVALGPSDLGFHGDKTLDGQNNNITPDTVTPTTNHLPKVSPKPEGDNVMTTSDLQTLSTIMKLKEKVAKKLKEKEALKSIAKDQRLLKKICAKFRVFSSSLNRFTRILDELSKIGTVTDQDILRWKETVQKYHSILPPLNTCVEHFMKSKHKVTDLVDCQECHVRLIDITENLKKGGLNSKLPECLRKELQKCRKKMKNHRALCAFINEDFENIKNAIIERKENGSEKESF